VSLRLFVTISDSEDVCYITYVNVLTTRSIVTRGLGVGGRTYPVLLNFVYS
jgi:hypothetical protein